MPGRISVHCPDAILTYLTYKCSKISDLFQKRKLEDLQFLAPLPKSLTLVILVITERQNCH